MRLALLTSFDVGVSYGLDDLVFSKEGLGPVYDISWVGVINPLGRGVVVDLQRDHAQLVANWVEEAVAQVDRPEMELLPGGGPATDDPEFAAALKSVVASHEFSTISITVYAVGVALLKIETSPGVPLSLLPALGSCFEFAAYRPSISDGIRSAAKAAATSALRDPSRNRLSTLTRRDDPVVTNDEHGYSESNLLTDVGFTNLFLLVDSGDAEVTDELKDLGGIPADAPIVSYEDHGTLTFTWASCILRARSLGGGEPESPSNVEGRLELARMVADAEIAHSFQGVCRAFAALFRDEMSAQVGGYAAGRVTGRLPQDLNRLRSLALAVTTVTDLDHVTSASEDRAYFSLFQAEAKLVERRDFIEKACEILYNVQQAEVENEQARRDRALSYILAGLTTFTVVSVAADAYNFVRQEDPIIDERTQRFVLLIEFLFVLCVLAITLIFLLSRRGPRSR